MSEETVEKPTWAASIDKAVFGFCELLALVFALPFGDALYHGTPVSGAQIGFLVLGGLWAAAGPMWPMIRSEAAQPVKTSLEHAARDARTWIAVLLFAFGYLFFRNPPPPSAADIVDSLVAKLPHAETADEIADAVIRKMPKQASGAAQDAQIIYYGIDGQQQFHAIVSMTKWQDYKEYKGVLITRVVYADRDRMNDDWIAKSIAYTIDEPNLAMVAITNNQMHFAAGATNLVEYDFVVIPADKVPEQIRMLGDVTKLGGKILTSAAQGIPVSPVTQPEPLPSPPVSH